MVPASYGNRIMALRSLTKAPKLGLVYFTSDKSTCIVETKRLRDRETQKFIDFEPPKMIY